MVDFDPKNSKIVAAGTTDVDRTKASDDQVKSYTEMLNDLVKEKEEKIAPPAITVGSCSVCQHTYRDWIELMIGKGMAYAAISRRVPPEGVTEESFRKAISNHAKKHMRLQEIAMRAIMEEEASTLNQNYEESVRGAITAQGIVEIAIRKAFDNIQNDVAFVEPKDLIQLIKLQREMQSNSSDIAVEQARIQVQIFIQAIKDVAKHRLDGDDLLKEITSRVKELRERDDIEIALENSLPRTVGLPAGEPIEAEVVED